LSDRDKLNLLIVQNVTELIGKHCEKRLQTLNAMSLAQGYQFVAVPVGNGRSMILAVILYRNRVLIGNEFAHLPMQVAFSASWIIEHQPDGWRVAKDRSGTFGHGSVISWDQVIEMCNQPRSVVQSEHD
jgi:hypothetical protein